jgi:rare lipoprotein A (peptidoglycan hydrolase)
MTTRSLGVRAVALLGVAILAAALALGLTRHHRHSGLPEPAGKWIVALAAPYANLTKPQKTPCGVVIGPQTKGVAHPVLPCGVKLYVRYGGKTALTQVVDRGPDAPGRDFDVTPALARELGLVGTRRIEYSLAR